MGPVRVAQVLHGVCVSSRAAYSSLRVQPTSSNLLMAFLTCLKRWFVCQPGFSKKSFVVNDSACRAGVLRRRVGRKITTSWMFVVTRPLMRSNIVKSQSVATTSNSSPAISQRPANNRETGLQLQRTPHHQYMWGKSTASEWGVCKMGVLTK